ncbi:efflux transporter periplasmic adaptor subunit, partial [Vibrio parahaemolyticus]|nr:efflux transporter periplasmic adaptor subunit [Vibrio parahaemolyticus]
KATVMTVNGENKVEAKPVKTAEAINSQWRIIDGLNAGDKVITAGLQKVGPGSSVTIQNGEQE